jgi:23S rRNA pseudouridine1911/1915/1917 synthase
MPPMDSEPVRIQVDAEHSRERLDLYLSGMFPELSRARLQKAIADGAVLLNGMMTVKKTRIAAGDSISIDKEKLVGNGPGGTCVAQDIPLTVLYEDEYCLAVDKPAGMVVHPGSGNRDGTLVHALLFHANSLSHGSAPQRPGIVHRLDKDTSGVILVAKNDDMHRRLAGLFSDRKVTKQYVGICCGRRPAEQGLIGARLGRSRRDPVKRSVRQDGKEAKTAFRLVSYQCGISVVQFSPHTGRTHQIRVHASVSGFPVVCDSLYGGGRDALARLPVLDRPFANRIYKCFNRQALHAHSITFSHPKTLVETTIRAPLPQDFVQAFSLFGECVDI